MLTSVNSDNSFAVETTESTYVLIAFAEASVLSVADTVVKSVSNTPLAKSATSRLVILLPVPLALNVLFVNVKVSEAMFASWAST